MDSEYNVQKDNELWQLAISKNSVLHYDKYLKAMPEGKYVQEALKKKEEILQLQERQMEDMWHQALTENTYFAVLRFKNKYPKSIYAAEADKKLLELQASKGKEIQQIDEKFVVPDEEGEFFAPEKKGIKAGVLGGIIMIAIALIWFFAGLAAGYIYYYPPILFFIGLYALIKGLVSGNLAGKKE
jgi:hypothetical protein